MTKALRHIPEEQQTRVATRRLQNGINGERGNGFWAAKDYFLKNGMRLPGQLGTMQMIGQALERMEHGGGFSTSYAGSSRDRRHQDNGGGKGHSFGKSQGGRGSNL